MVITVVTNGPGNSAPTVLTPRQHTYSDMISVISDEIDDTTNEYNAQIGVAIVAAIRFCEREPLYFNESREQSFYTVVGQQWYTADQFKQLAAVGNIIAAYAVDQRGTTNELTRKSAREYETLTNANAAGQPRFFTYFGQQLGLYPIADRSTYKIRLLLAPARLLELTLTDSSSPWFNEAFDLVKARAKYHLYKDFLKDAPLALAAYNDFTEQLTSLRAETSRRAGNGFIQPTRF